MKVNKETRRQAKQLLQASFIDGKLDRSRIQSLVTSVIEKKPRGYIRLLEVYTRLLRLESEKRTATIETATEPSPALSAAIVSNLQRKYGSDLTARFAIKPELLGGMRIRVGSDVCDSTVRNRLQRLEHQL